MTCTRENILSDNALLILNDPPYGTERAFNGLRLAGALAKRDGVDVRVFLTGDGVAAAMASQKLPRRLLPPRLVLLQPARAVPCADRHLVRVRGRKVHSG